jgi:hypothetical protein
MRIWISVPSSVDLRSVAGWQTCEAQALLDRAGSGGSRALGGVVIIVEGKKSKPGVLRVKRVDKAT